MEVHLYLPQMRLTPGEIAERVIAAEHAGFDGVALMDHLAPPLAEDQPMLEGMTLAGWIAGKTERITLSHLVLCAAFRHPAVLAREAVTVDHVSSGRFELGLGSGSVPNELRTFGLPAGGSAQRLARLEETLSVVTGLWSGEPVDHVGEHFTLTGARQRPQPTRGRIPIVLGGTSSGMLRLTRQYADWWNLPPGQFHRLNELAAEARPARVSVLEMFSLDSASDRSASATAKRRFGHMGTGLVTGTATELRDHLAELSEGGVERVYAWFADFAPSSTLERFGADVLSG